MHLIVLFIIHALALLPGVKLANNHLSWSLAFVKVSSQPYHLESTNVFQFFSKLFSLVIPLRTLRTFFRWNVKANMTQL